MRTAAAGAMTTAMVLAVSLLMSAFVYAQAPPMRPPATTPGMKPVPTAPLPTSSSAPSGTAPPAPGQGTAPGQGAAPGEENGEGPAPEGAEGEDMLYAPHPPLAMAPAEDLAGPGGGAGDQGQMPDLPSETGIQLSGYFYGYGGVDFFPPAIPRFRVQVSPSLGTTGGLIFRGMPYENIQYMIHLGVNASVGSEIIPAQGLSVRNPQGAGFAAYVDEASVQWGTETFSIKGGHMRIPYSLSHPGIITGRVFVGRPIQTQAFIIGADDGALVNLATKDYVVSGRAGVFNGTSLGLYSTRLSRDGPLFVASVLAQPFGLIPYGEVDAERGPFKLAFGMGGMTAAGKYYDGTGYSAIGYRDSRLVASVAASFKGAFFQVEGMRKVATDDYSGRPSAATAIYAQASYFVPVAGTFAISPVGRFGTMGLEEISTDDDGGDETNAGDPDNSSRARKSNSLELGLAIYPQADQPSALKILLEYQSIRYINEAETAYGGYMSFLLAF